MGANTCREGWEAAELRLGAPLPGSSTVFDRSQAGTGLGFCGPALPEPTPHSAKNTVTRRCAWVPGTVHHAHGYPAHG